MVTHTLKILQHLLQDFYSVSDYFGTWCIKGLSIANMNELKLWQKLIDTFIFLFEEKKEMRLNNIRKSVV